MRQSWTLVADATLAYFSGRLADGPWLRLPAHHAKISLRPMARAFPFSALPTADLVVDAVYEGGTKGNTGDEVLGKLIPGAGNHGGFRVVGSWDVRRLVILYSSMDDAVWPDLSTCTPA